MPQIHIRRFLPTDLPALLAIDHSYNTEYVWQMDIQRLESGLGVTFREQRLPRIVRQTYPRDSRALIDDWQYRWGILVAVIGPDPEKPPQGYTSLERSSESHIALLKDMAVAVRARRQGVGAALVLSAEDWSASQGCTRLVIEMPSKNHPAIRLAQKLGYEFCGFADAHFPNKDIALHFGKSLG